MTDEMYARIREVADEHDGRVDVTIAHPDLTTPVIAHPREDRMYWRNLPPEVYMTEADAVDFRERIRAEGLTPFAFEPEARARDFETKAVWD